DYDRYLDEAGEQVAAGMIYWRNTLKLPTRYEMLFNEPLSGNRELVNGNTQNVVDLVKRVGHRLRREGFADTKFVIPNEETEEQSLATATAILADPVARHYVGAIGYHPYPYGSIYSSVSNILNTSGQGKPDPSRILIRQRLRDLGKQYGIPVWMTEVSHGGVNPLSFDALRARAIHIHDELVYADAAAYFGMNNMWDTVSQKAHSRSANLLSPANEGAIVFIDTGRQVVYISGMGYAIGHYARWVKRGAVRIDGTSANPLIQVTAFEDDNKKRLVLVLINNMTADSNLNVKVNGVTLTGHILGEQSTDAAAWQSLAPVAPTSSSTINVRLPALSVTTIVGPIQ
ncbi:MAG: glycoside hydrolase family 30 beta sandwich domain-containing protein, partial [Gammaproteobacteria bacterium]